MLGCLAEELGGGGKIALLERGAFADADVAMMVHPSIGDVGWAPHIANTRFTVEMHGKAAHAAAAPCNGDNALDAMSPEGDAGLVHGAKAMAMTAIDLFRRPELVEDARAELASRQARYSNDA